MMNYFVAVAFLSVVTLFTSPVFGQVRSSGSFQLQQDIISSGGNRSTSPSFQLEDTVGEFGAGNSTSPSFQLDAGYQQREQVITPRRVVVEEAVGAG